MQNWKKPLHFNLIYIGGIENNPEKLQCTIFEKHLKEQLGKTKSLGAQVWNSDLFTCLTPFEFVSFYLLMNSSYT